MHKKILTLTMNPAVDVSARAPTVAPTHKIRCGDPTFHPGGGGVNVARVVCRLGAEATALYPAGGVTGELLRRLLDSEGVPSESVPVAGDTRESFSVHDDASGLDWRFVLPGPTLGEAEWRECLARTALACRGAALLVASGSLPPGVPDDFYGRVAEQAARDGVPLVLDTSGKALAAALEAGVHLVKPSLRELRELSGGALLDTAEQVAACREIIGRNGAQAVALSLGEDGALLVTREAAWRAPALRVKVLSTIGAGDSFLGGLVAGLAAGEAMPHAFRGAMAASAAALLSPGTALCRPEDVQRLRADVQVSELAGH
ncbi:1-phosphofructokinase family hexose kinase [Ramlibacter sp. AN1015]|uniref:1-phosphofructokinase family hexose kinase n=1 Tax=Ramlibacter sp. AN1015 TaxID=3133428 RepID=UPI0030C191B2